MPTRAVLLTAGQAVEPEAADIGEKIGGLVTSTLPPPIGGVRATRPDGAMPKNWLLTGDIGGAPTATGRIEPTGIGIGGVTEPGCCRNSGGEKPGVEAPPPCIP
mmetsp:Transcript_15643/g.54536  ORF Transcript_15643/g.54536 Transcript_15643/m.54536 type:complete len:104 (-) Transcript_15643:154-465(-)